MNPKSQRGFTLIELLVVIAIIGILASVVLASLNSARDKGADAAVKANLANIRAQAQLYYEDNSSSYGDNTDTCDASSTVFTDPTVANAIDAAEDASGATAQCDIVDGDWAILVPTSDGSNWCVDSAGYSGTASSGATGLCV